MCCLPHRLSRADQAALALAEAELAEVRRRARACFEALSPDLVPMLTPTQFRREIVAVWVGDDGEPRVVDPQSPAVLRRVEEILREANELVPA